MAWTDLLTGRIAARLSGDGVILLELRDTEGRNALTDTFQRELCGFLAQAYTIPQARVIVLAGLPDIFCSGASKGVLHDLVDGRFEHLDLAVTGAMLATRLPIVAAMEGSAVGGGFVLGLASDIVILAEQSRYGMNFIDYGITPGMGATRIMEHVLTPAVAHELLYTGELRRGSAFRECGGVNYVLPREEVRAKALDIAARIAEKSPLAVQTLKAHLNRSRRLVHEECRVLEAMMFQICTADPQLRDRIAANYID
jgi:polyketide biosynthesis enoyl-CoA hydratase PksI